MTAAIKSDRSFCQHSAPAGPCIQQRVNSNIPPIGIVRPGSIEQLDLSARPQQLFPVFTNNSVYN